MVKNRYDSWQILTGILENVELWFLLHIEPKHSRSDAGASVAQA